MGDERAKQTRRYTRHPMSPVAAGIFGSRRYRQHNIVRAGAISDNFAAVDSDGKFTPLCR